MSGLESEPLSGSDTDLFEDGPVDLPITIAKLDGANLGNTTVSVVPGGGYQTVTITGATGAVNYAQTQKVIVYTIADGVVLEESKLSVDVNPDGSFLLETQVTAEQELIFAPATTSEDSWAKPTRLVFSETGDSLFIGTNSNKITEDAGLSIGDEGDALITLEDPETDTRSLVFQSTLDAETTALIEDTTKSFSEIALDAEENLGFITDEGRYGLYDKIEDSYIYKSLGTLDSTPTENTDLFVIDNDLVILHEDEILFVTPQGEETSLFQGEAEDPLLIAVSGNKIFVITQNGDDTVLYSLDPSLSPEQMWENKTLITNLPAGSTPVSFDVSDNGLLFTFHLTMGDNDLIGYYSVESGMVQINSEDTDQNHYASPHVAPDGSVIVFCRIADDGSNQLVTFRPGIDEMGAVRSLSANNDYRFCSEDPKSIAINDNKTVVFFMQPIDESSAPQIGFIPLETKFENAPDLNEIFNGPDCNFIENTLPTEETTFEFEVLNEHFGPNLAYCVGEFTYHQGDENCIPYTRIEEAETTCSFEFNDYLEGDGEEDDDIFRLENADLTNSFTIYSTSPERGLNYDTQSTFDNDIGTDLIIYFKFNECVDEASLVEEDTFQIYEYNPILPPGDNFPNTNYSLVVEDNPGDADTDDNRRVTLTITNGLVEGDYLITIGNNIGNDLMSCEGNALKNGETTSVYFSITN